MNKKILAIALFGVGVCYLGYTGFQTFRPLPKVTPDAISAVDEIYALSGAIATSAVKYPTDIRQGDIATTLIKTGNIPDKYVKDGMIIDTKGDPIIFNYEPALNAIRVNYTIMDPQQCIMAAQAAMTIPGYIPYLKSTGIKDIPALVEISKKSCSNQGDKTLNFVWSLNPAPGPKNNN